MASLKFMPKSHPKFVAKVIFLPSLEVGVFLLLKPTFPHLKPQKTSKSGCGKARGLWHWAAYGLLHSAGVFFCCFFWVILGGRFNPFYRDSCNSKQPVITNLHHQITWYILHVCCFERTFQWPAPASEQGGRLILTGDRHPGGQSLGWIHP